MCINMVSHSKSFHGTDWSLISSGGGGGGGIAIKRTKYKYPSVVRFENVIRIETELKKKNYKSSAHHNVHIVTCNCLS